MKLKDIPGCLKRQQRIEQTLAQFYENKQTYSRYVILFKFSPT